MIEAAQKRSISMSKQEQEAIQAMQAARPGKEKHSMKATDAEGYPLMGKSWEAIARQQDRRWTRQKGIRWFLVLLPLALAIIAAVLALFAGLPQQVSLWIVLVCSVLSLLAYFFVPTSAIPKRPPMKRGAKYR
jgi:Flp pilus assembly protein TadB